MARNSLVDWHGGAVDAEIFHKGELFSSQQVHLW